MGYIDRFLLFLYAVTVALGALGAIALWLGVIPETETVEWLKLLLSRWETVAGAALVFFISVHLAASSFSGKKAPKEPDAIVIRGEAGEVHVAVSAVEQLAEKTAKAVDGVESAKATVSSKPSEKGPSVGISMDVVMGAGRGVSEISDAIRSAVSSQATRVLGLGDCRIDVSVSEISDANALKKQRVS